RIAARTWDRPRGEPSRAGYSNGERSPTVLILSIAATQRGSRHFRAPRWSRLIEIRMTVLGLDIGGANLKAATSDNRAISVPFALWKQPDQLPAALTELVARFPDANELAITMTGELCDCYETKRQGVNAILDAAAFSAKGRPVRVWSTAGKFVGISEARQNHLGVAAANWHALATFAGRFAPHRGALLIDIGSTSTDVIPLRDGVPAARGLTDRDRLQSRELV